ncbi:MAG: glutamate--tRNA ligase [Candidatus Bathyarchaeota archaeon]|uniref:glutamate--tRNA ligase n=1 Tax=Candidatus Bathycorpusculum sp. TaxID=2994959 RepID=UPI00282983D4|nr:glutamate--tRNA ligase [Candidatus Termiticorpusculum sp.]MCL2256723.1 glutamate--tRNA ligase [Candidatus Termiticorpusculum sp.]
MALEQDKDLRELIRKAALLNAVSHDGKAQAGAMVGKVLGERQDLRSYVKELSAVINSVVNEVNSYSLSEQKDIVEQNWPETQKKEKPEEKKLPALPNLDKFKQIVTRFSPNPDCVLHLGSARAIMLSHEYARIYNGKFILRFEDTDPKIKKPALEFYENIRRDLKWLGVQVDEEYIQSDRLPIYYEHVEKLVVLGAAYVCECAQETFHKITVLRQACPCRDLSPLEHLERWHKMLNGDYKEGQAVVRVKTELDHPNPAVRDWPALRIIDTKKHPHPRVGSKYTLWPLYNLAAGIDDYLMGITHIIRGKEHYTNMIRQKYMYKALGWEYPEAIHYGRLKITDAFLSKSKIMAGIREGTYVGFDDPRLGTFAALRKRGITSEAIKKMIIDVGVKANDVTLSWENLYAHNRKILDNSSDRYFFVSDPVELKVNAIPKTFISKIPLYPEKPERGFREYTITPNVEENASSFWVSKKDTLNMELGKIVRFMELFNIEITKINQQATIDAIEPKMLIVEAKYYSESYDDVRRIKAQIIQWIPKGTEVNCEIVLQNAQTIEGFAESESKKLKPDSTIQFERFGFTRIDKVNQKLVAYYTHK